MSRDDHGSKRPLLVIGAEGCHFSSHAMELALSCRVIAASGRLQEAFEAQAASMGLEDRVASMEFIPMTPVGECLDRIAGIISSPGDEPRRCAILASGDPLFHGIGRLVLRRFAPEAVEFVPALSSVQMACALAGIPWDQAEVFSFHGRPADMAAFEILPALTGGRTAVVLTDGENTPDRLSAMLLAHLQAFGHRGLIEAVRMVVAQDLGCPGQVVDRLSLREAAERTFSPLNVVLFQVTDSTAFPRSEGPIFGLEEEGVEHLRGLITKDEIRAATLHALCPPAGKGRNVFWDIGAGSGSISLEMAGLCRTMPVFAVERRAELVELIRRNAIRYGRLNVLPVEGSAPEVLPGLPEPALIFVGGSGGRLEEILLACAERLAPSGILVVNAVLESTRQKAPKVLQKAGLQVRWSEISVRRYRASSTERLNTITIIRAKKE